MGWWVLDDLRERWHFDAWRKDGVSLTSSGSLGTTKVRLVKPQTYMNLSGQALRPFLKRESWTAKNDLLVVVDEVQLPVGTWRYRADGSPGGHNGLKDIERAVGGREYSRLRIGVGPEDPARRRGDLADYVLGRFGRAEAAATKELLPVIAEAIEGWIKVGAKGALDVQSRKPREASE